MMDLEQKSNEELSEIMRDVIRIKQERHLKRISIAEKAAEETAKKILAESSLQKGTSKVVTVLVPYSFRLYIKADDEEVTPLLLLDKLNYEDYTLEKANELKLEFEKDVDFRLIKKMVIDGMPEGFFVGDDDFIEYINLLNENLMNGYANA
jgi:hypothetical protein